MIFSTLSSPRFSFFVSFHPYPIIPSLCLLLKFFLRFHLPILFFTFSVSFIYSHSACTRTFLPFSRLFLFLSTSSSSHCPLLFLHLLHVVFSSLLHFLFVIPSRPDHFILFPSYWSCSYFFIFFPMFYLRSLSASFSSLSICTLYSILFLFFFIYHFFIFATLSS